MATKPQTHEQMNDAAVDAITHDTECKKFIDGIVQCQLAIRGGNISGEPLQACRSAEKIFRQELFSQVVKHTPKFDGQDCFLQADVADIAYVKSMVDEAVSMRCQIEYGYNQVALDKERLDRATKIGVEARFTQNPASEKYAEEERQALHNIGKNYIGEEYKNNAYVNKALESKIDNLIYTLVEEECKKQHPKKKELEEGKKPKSPSQIERPVEVTLNTR